MIAVALLENSRGSNSAPGRAAVTRIPIGQARPRARPGRRVTGGGAGPGPLYGHGRLLLLSSFVRHDLHRLSDSRWLRVKYWWQSIIIDQVHEPSDCFLSFCLFPSLGLKQVGEDFQLDRVSCSGSACQS